MILRNEWNLATIMDGEHHQAPPSERPATLHIRPDGEGFCLHTRECAVPQSLTVVLPGPQ